MARGSQTIRLLKLIHRLNLATLTHRPVRINELTKLFGVTRRTVYRDLDFVQEAGFALVGAGEDGGFRGGIRLESAVTLPTRTLDIADLGALVIARSALSSAADMPGCELFRDLVDGLVDSALTPTVREHLTTLGRLVDFRRRPGRRNLGPRDVPGLVSRALTERRKLEIEYHTASRDARSTRVIHPYEEVATETATYVYAWCETAGDLRTFALNRIVGARLLDATFTANPTYQPRNPERFAICDGTPRKIRLRFDKSKAYYARERRWHETQKLRDLPDGSVELTFTAAGGLEIQRFVLGWGGAVEVLEPDDLRRCVHEQAAACAGRNGGPASPPTRRARKPA